MGNVKPDNDAYSCWTQPARSMRGRERFACGGKQVDRARVGRANGPSICVLEWIETGHLRSYRRGERRRVETLQAANAALSRKERPPIVRNTRSKRRNDAHACDRDTSWSRLRHALTAVQKNSRQAVPQPRLATVVRAQIVRLGADALSDDVVGDASDSRKAL